MGIRGGSSGGGSRGWAAGWDLWTGRWGEGCEPQGVCVLACGRQGAVHSRAVTVPIPVTHPRAQHAALSCSCVALHTHCYWGSHLVGCCKKSCGVPNAPLGEAEGPQSSADDLYSSCSPPANTAAAFGVEQRIHSGPCNETGGRKQGENDCPKSKSSPLKANPSPYKQQPESLTHCRQPYVGPMPAPAGPIGDVGPMSLLPQEPLCCGAPYLHS